MFVVSSKNYVELKKKSNKSNTTTIQTLEETEIPALQDHLRNMAVERRLEALCTEKNVVDSALISLVGALQRSSRSQVVIDPEMVERKSRILNMVQEAREKIVNLSEGVCNTIISMFKQNSENRLPIIEENAVERVLDKLIKYESHPGSKDSKDALAGLYWKELWAVCTHQGEHKSMRVEFDWNKDASDELKAHIEHVLKTMFGIVATDTEAAQNVQVMLQDAATNIIDCINSLDHELQNIVAELDFPLATITGPNAQHNFRVVEVRTAFTATGKKLAKVYKAPTTKMISNICDSWAKGQQQASEVKRGPGFKQRMAEGLRGSFDRDQANHTALDQLCKSIRSKTENRLSIFKTRLNGVIDAIVASYRKELEEPTPENTARYWEKHAAVFSQVLNDMKARGLVPDGLLLDSQSSEETLMHESSEWHDAPE